jgi:NAD(P)-dependent dehydrogenase (short-subunit alcohol dehydrogenase family)/acyl carrier protein
VDWSDNLRTEPELMQRLLNELVLEIENRTFSPLPVRKFAVENVVDAFRYMTKARHIGKIVLTQPGENAVSSSFHADATYLITGGLRGLGSVVAKWMVGKGARHLVLLGRNGPDEAAQRSIQEMEAQGVKIVVAQADVSVADELRTVFEKIARELPPLRGVIHSAGVLADGMLINQKLSNFTKVFAAKVDGAWHLHELTKNMSLDFFVLFSSIASILGSRGQANHAAANTFIDMLAYHRQAQGLPALSINWGAWSQIGAAADHGVTERISQQGLAAFTPEEGLQVLEFLFTQKTPQVAVAPINWSVFARQYRAGAAPLFFADVIRDMQGRTKSTEAPKEKQVDLRLQLEQASVNKRQPLLIAYIQSQVSKVLGLASGQEVNEDRPLSELGLDSLMAVEVRNILGSNLNLKRALPATLVFDYPTVSAIASYLMTEIDLAGNEQAEERSSKPQKEVPVTDSMLSLLDAIEDLSDEDVDRMLASQLKEGKTNNE